MTKDTLLKALCKEALDQLLAHFGTKAEMSRKAGMSRNAIGLWFTRGQVGRKAAIKFGKNKVINMTKEDMRPDIVNWTPVAKRKVAVKK